MNDPQPHAPVVSRPAAALAMLGAAWCACFVYAVSRSLWVDSAAHTLSKTVSFAIPSWNPQSEDYNGCLSFGGGTHAAWCFIGSRPGEAGVLDSVREMFRATLPWSVDSATLALQLMLVPLHAAVCFACLLWFSWFGYPHSVGGATASRTFVLFWRTAFLSAIWLALPPFIASFWQYATTPTVTAHALAAPLVDARDQTLEVVAWGALLGYLGTVSLAARKHLWRTQPQTSPADAASWATCCHHCAYTPDGGDRCPECGSANPRAIGMIYWTKHHAMIARGRTVDPLRIFWATAVLAMLAWPLLQGVALGKSLYVR